MLPDDATMSAEADILPFDDEDEAKADQLDGLLGEASHLYDKYGIYADGVSSLCEGRRVRGVRIPRDRDGQRSVLDSTLRSQTRVPAR